MLNWKISDLKFEYNIPKLVSCGYGITDKLSVYGVVYVNEKVNRYFDPGLTYLIKNNL